MNTILNYINGELTPPLEKQYLDNINPATGEVYGKTPSSNKTDTEKAIQAAKSSFKTWSNLSYKERAKYLEQIADKIQERFDEFALAECIDTGKPISLCKAVDIPRSISNLRFFAKECQGFSTHEFSDQGAGLNTVHYSPLGVVACISPWNLPLYLFTWKIAPALAAGCTVIAKPSEVTPMTAFLFSEIAKDILPPGVLNIVHGLGQNVGETLSSHPDILALSFTGSTFTGKKIAISAAPTMKKLHLEMGGKNPNIIFADCDFEKALTTTVRSSFSNQGQICLCGSRIYVEDSIYEKFKTALISEIEKLIQADPTNSSTQQGAVVSKTHFEKILNCINLAKSEGAKILIGGEQNLIDGDSKNGYFIKPTLLEGLSNSSITIQEEIFGPVAMIAPFSSIEEVIEAANCTKYGLAGSIWTEDLEKANSVALKVDSGIMWINTWLKRDLRTPFGGMKESGRGREGGQYILKFFSKTKNICVGN
jgi:aminomuconate-semialdehyde/2-hydroxymuconate-6-semialdehyde dehydrogenase